MKTSLQSSRTDIPTRRGLWRASASVALAAAVAAVAAEDRPAAQLQQQAAEVKAFAIAEVRKQQPSWTPAQREFWATGYHDAVLAAAGGPLGERQVADLKLVVAHAAKSNYQEMPRARLEYQRAVAHHVVGELLRTPRPSDGDLQTLRAQTRELASYLEVELRERVDVSEEVVGAAAKHALDIYLYRIDQPMFRFDRKPMTDEQMERARGVIERCAEEGAAEWRDDIEKARKNRWDASTQEYVNSIALSALADAAQECWAWHELPEQLKELGVRAAEAAAVHRGCGAALKRIHRLLYLVMGAVNGPEPLAGNAAAPGPSRTRREQVAAWSRLRGALRPAAEGRYRARVMMYLGEGRADGGDVQPWPLVEFEMEYRADADGIRAVVTYVPQRESRNDIVESLGLTYEVTSKWASIVRRDGSPVAAYTDWTSPPRPLPADMGLGPLGPVPAGPYLLALGRMIDPRSFRWQAVEEEAALEPGVEVFEARRAQPCKVLEPYEVRRLRYWFDTERRAVTRIVTYDPEGISIGDTVYDDFMALPDGSQVALRATETIPPGEAPALLERRTEPDLEGTVHCVGLTIVTEYKWFPEARVRLPLKREITDEGGQVLCLLDFFDH
ncbi:MAG: hypothetical protein ACE5JM_14195, partial [Armatimonadota bacterium]